MKKWFVYTGLLMLSAALIGCGKGNDAPAESQAATAPGEELVTEDLLDQVKVDVGNYKGLKVTVPEMPEMTDEFIDSQIEAVLQSGQTEKIDKEAVIAEGDMVSIDYQLFYDGQPVDDAVSNYYLTVGSGVFFDGADAIIIGAKGDDGLEQEVTLPEAYPDPKVAGKTVKMFMTVNGKVTEGEATLNEDYIKQMTDGQCSTVEEFRQFVREQLEGAFEMQKQMGVENACWQALTKQMKVEGELPQSLIDTQVNEYIQYDIAGAEEQGMPIEDYVQEWYGITYDEYVAQLGEMAREDLMIKLAMREITKQEGLSEEQLTDADIQAYAESEGYGSVDYMKEVFGDDSYKAQVLKKKVSKILIDNAEITE